MIRFIRWIVGAPAPFRKTDGCDGSVLTFPSDAAFISELTDRLEACEIADDNQGRRQTWHADDEPTEDRL